MQTTTTHLARLARPLADVHVRLVLAIVLLPFALAAIGAAWSALAGGTRAAEPAPIIIVATPALPVATSGPETAAYQPPRAIQGYFDYANPRSAVAITSAEVARVVGWAGDWRLVETRQGGRVWIGAIDVPPDAPVDNPLADLAPAPTPIIVYVEVPAAVPEATVEVGPYRVQTVNPDPAPIVIKGGQRPIVIDHGQKRQSP